ncbi:MAG: MMPL family transporter, partial [Rugosibacter sp.]
MVTRAFVGFRDKLTHMLHRGEDWLFANPKIVLAIVGIATAAFASQVPKLQIFSDFNDLLPQKHEYIQVYNRMKENFGGANSVIMAIEVEKGTIFNEKTLGLIHKATQGVDNLPSVNHNLVSSMAHRTVRKVSLSPEGGFVSELYYDSQNPQYTPERLAKLQADILADPAVYGLLVSPDMKAALIRAQLNEGTVDYPKFFAELKTLRDSLETAGHKVHVTGNPVLTAWVYTYLPEMVSILAWTAVLLAALLIVYYRRLYGIALPILGIALSTLWGLGFMAAMGINLEPLSLPIPFLIAARAMSHGTQLVSRYYEELDVHKDAALSARKTLEALFRPGSLAIIVDAIGITVLM